MFCVQEKNTNNLQHIVREMETITGWEIASVNRKIEWENWKHKQKNNNGINNT